MFGKWIGLVLGVLLGLFMPWPWPLLPMAIGFLLGLAWDNLTRHPEIYSETPKTTRELLEELEALEEEPPPFHNGKMLNAGATTHKRHRALPGPPALPSEEELHESTLARLLCPIFTQVAIADGPINKQEIRLIRLYFENNLAFSEWGLSAVRAELKAWLRKTADISELLLLAEPHIFPAMRMDFVSTLYALALVDGQLQRAERELLQRVVRALGLSDAQLYVIRSSFFGDGREHLDTLNLPPDASDEEIKTAYRKLAVAYHPDSNLKMSPAQLQQATEAFHRIQEAYDALRKIRGF